MSRRGRSETRVRTTESAPGRCHFVTFAEQTITSHCERPGRPRVIRDLGENVLCDEHAGLLQSHPALVDFQGEQWIGLRGPTTLDEVLP